MQNIHWILQPLSQSSHSHYLFRFIWQLFSEELIRVNYSNTMFIYRLLVFIPMLVSIFCRFFHTMNLLNLVTSVYLQPFLSHPGTQHPFSWLKKLSVTWSPPQFLSAVPVLWTTVSPMFLTCEFCWDVMFILNHPVAFLYSSSHTAITIELQDTFIIPQIHFYILVHLMLWLGNTALNQDSTSLKG